MKIKLKIIGLILVLCAGASVFAQEGLAPLLSNESLHQTSQVQFKQRSIHHIEYQFKFDTIDLPFIDDFSKSRFKKYSYDTANALVDSLVWQNFLVDSVYIDKFDAMLDTSYHFTKNSGNGNWDSVANPVVYITNLSQVDYQMVIDTDTVWVFDTLIVDGNVDHAHKPDVNYINFSDTVVVVPSEGLGDIVDTGSLWRNSNVLHNYTYSANPITLGMATFDGLDSTGMPYDPSMNSNSYQIADILESKPIYLKTHPNGGDYSFLDDDVYFSFYYQPQGLGDSPQPKDSLVLEFFSPFTNKWVHMWSVPGEGVHPFKSVIIPVNNPIFFMDGFKFRFKNYASVSGNFDHWNIDYVRMAENRNAGDTTYNDVGLMDPGYSLLKDYYQMPWTHFQNSTKNLMKDEQLIRYRNVGMITHFAQSRFNAYDDGVLIIASDCVINPQFGPLEIGGEVSLVSGTYPITSTDTVKSFNIVYLAEVNPDLNHHNDTAFFHQQFGTQYAYDDGSAESAYYVSSAGTQIAVQYDIAVGDSLRAVNIYFPRSFESIVDRAYRVMIWKSIDPEEILYESYLYYPQYSGGRDLVQGVELEVPLYVEGTIFVGIKQLDQQIYIGMDRNMDSQSKNFYKVGGIWYNSSFTGSLFIRPEFGTTLQWPLAVDEVNDVSSDFSLYPNPSSGWVNLEMESFENIVVLRSVLGVEIQRLNTGKYCNFDASYLSAGLYLVEVTDVTTNHTIIKKLLIQH